MEVFAQGLFRTLSLEIGLAEDLKKLDVAESAIKEKKEYLNAHPELPSRLKYRYLADAGYLAEIEGHKPDALLYFSQGFRESTDDPSAEIHARGLWKELSGTEEGFNAWKSALAKIDRMPLPANQDRSPWTAMDKPLTALHGADTSGRVWTNEMVGVEGVPRTWIVDSKGSVRFEAIGYDRILWPKLILQQLEAVK